MNRINNKNLENLKAFYGAYQVNKPEVEEKKEDSKPVKEYEPKKVEASALDLTAAQIWGVKLSKVDTSDAAVERRMEEAFANSPFIKALDELNDDGDNFVQYAMANITGVNHEKLAQYLNKPLSETTISAMMQF